MVIDAGHGGHDCGAKGAISFEKNLTLRYALAFGNAVKKACPDVNVVYTRKTDVFIPLHERADIANRNNADLFISIHINALGGGKISHGFQSYTLGRGERTGSKGLKENVEVAKRENSVILMEKDYRTRYSKLKNSAESDIMFEFIADKNRERSVELSKLMQREVCKATGRVDGGAHQNNLAVLRLTSMPASLLELGFITTPDEENFLNTDSALDLYTKGILNAFMIYKDKYGSNKIDVPYRDSDSALVGQRTRSNRRNTESRNNNNSRSRQSNRNVDNNRDRDDNRKVDESEPVFKVQIFAGANKLNPKSSLFKGLKDCESFKDDDRYRYTYGSSNNYNEIRRLRKEILDKFPDCFIIAMKNGKPMDVNEGIREFLKNKRK